MNSPMDMIWAGVRRAIRSVRVHAILDQDIQTLFDRQGRIEYDQAKTQREDIVAGTDFEEVANSRLQ